MRHQSIQEEAFKVQLYLKNKKKSTISTESSEYLTQAAIRISNQKKGTLEKVQKTTKSINKLPRHQSKEQLKISKCIKKNKYQNYKSNGQQWRSSWLLMQCPGKRKASVVGKPPRGIHCSPRHGFSTFTQYTHNSYPKKKLN